MEQLVGMVPSIAAFITSSGIILAFAKKWLVEPINNKIDSLELSSVKTDLINYMCLADKFELTYEQKQNAYELFDRYDKLGGNGYVHNKWEVLKKEGKI